MEFHYKLEEKRTTKNIIYLAIIILLLFTLFFSNYFSKLLLLKSNYDYTKETEIHFINVGQGDAIAIKFNTGKTMLIDSGTVLYKEKLFNYLDNIVLFDKNTIDYLVLTHIDTDHSGNMADILKKYNIGVFYRPKCNSKVEDINNYNTNDTFDEIISIAKDKNIEMKYNEVGITLTEGITTLTWLSPLFINLNDKLENNEYSPVIRLDYKDCSALFTGDISEEIEENLVETYLDKLDIDILKVAHHGSAYSTSYEFLKKTSPKYACISVGENTYGHPSEKLLNRILEYDLEFGTNLFNNIYNTKEDGNIVFALGKSINITMIDNIDNYIFINYYYIVIIAIVVILYYMLLPYAHLFKKNLRFYLQNKEFNKNKKDI